MQDANPHREQRAPNLGPAHFGAVVDARTSLDRSCPNPTSPSLLLPGLIFCSFIASPSSLHSDFFRLLLDLSPRISSNSP
ncbi:hypothetical protein VTN49DRAFT_7621 [Thermomyces lanuginosus]|uniref:uncharacterized protein n=1 Tax=Thermomyces lanuginosus TaxID=5541 RepID=UPI0037443364